MKLHKSVLMFPYEFIKDAYIGDVITVSELAYRVGIHEDYLDNAIKYNYSMTPEMALRLEAVLGIDAKMLLDMQTDKALEISKIKLKPYLEKLKPFKKL